MSQNKFKIMLVDDEPIIIDVMAAVLQDEYQLIVASNGQKAVELAKHQTPDIIVMDISMPVMDGIEAGEIIKNDPDTKHIPIIYCTAHNDRDKLIKVLRLGGSDFLQKPINAHELISRIKNQKEVIELRNENLKKDKMLIQQSKMAAMGEMIGAIAHQWRQPLNAVGVLAQEIQLRFQYGSLDEDELKSLTEELQHYLEYMSNTIDDFRNFYKPAKERLPFDIITAINNSLHITKNQLIDHNIDVTLNKVCEDKSIKNDKLIFNYEGFESEFKQVIINLINNAREAIDENSQNVEMPKKEIKIDVLRTTNNITIKIRDNGGGIKKEILKDIFNPYHSTKYEQQGTGLGLYMSKLIIERNMKGLLSAKNVPFGAEFQITLNTKQTV